MDPFPGHNLFPNRDTDNMQTQTADSAPMSEEDRTAECARLDGVIADAQARLEELSRNNDQAETGPTFAASKGQSNALRLTKKAVGWTLGVGVALLAGAFVYSKLQEVGVDADALADALPG